MKMRSELFGGNKRIERAADNMPSMRLHERSDGVQLMQIALVTFGVLPATASTFRKGLPDGIFGEETRRAVIAFQREHELKDDGIAGRNTLILMDDLLYAQEHPIGPATPDSQNGKLGRLLEARRLKSAVS